jgi:hypothetical protein
VQLRDEQMLMKAEKQFEAALVAARAATWVAVAAAFAAFVALLEGAPTIVTLLSAN